MIYKTVGKTLFLMTLSLLPLLSVADTSSDNAITNASNCIRPLPGAFEGACKARVGMNIEHSPFGLHKWIVCQQEKRGWGSGGYGDAVFFSDLIPEWEREIEANLFTLSELLTKDYRRRLMREQKQWQVAKQRAIELRSKKPNTPGTMHMAINSVTEMRFSERRAIELACRVEKLTSQK